MAARSAFFGQKLTFRAGAMLVLVLGSLSALLGVDLYLSYQREYAQVQRDADNLSAVIERQITANTDKIDVVLREAVFDYTPWVIAGGSQDRLSANQDLLRREISIPEAQERSLRVINAAGQVIYSAGESDALPKVNVADRAYFRKQQDDPDAGLVLSEPILSRFTGQWLFTLSRRISYPDGRFAGIVQTALRADYFQTGFKEIDVGAHGSIALFSDQLQLIARLPAVEEQLGKTFDVVAIRNALQSSQRKGAYQANSKLDGVPRLFVFRNLAPLPLVVNIGLAPQDFLVGWFRKAMLYGVSILALSLELAGLIIFQRRMHRQNVALLEQKVSERTQELETINGKLQAAMQEAEASSVVKSQFLATMSHELRTPMNGILGMAQLLCDDKVPPSEQRDYAETIVDSGKVLLTLLNDILDFSKLEAGKLDLKLGWHDLEKLVAHAALPFTELARGKGLQMHYHCEAPRHFEYEVDAIRLRQMLGNLLSNAIKFSAQGRIAVVVSVEPFNEQQVEIRFAVSDEGIGIPEDKLGLLFQPFSQLDGSSTRKYGGTGLGLSIVRTLAEQMGGRVGVESVVAQGATVWFSIMARGRERVVVMPAGGGQAAERSAQAKPLDPNVGHGRKILIVDDNLTNQKVLEALLKKLGADVIAASDGLQALELIKAQTPLDIVFMDCQMPVMDGFAATEAIRAWEQAGQANPLPIIALTAGVFEEDRERCFSVGMNDFLAKPVKLAEVTTVIDRWCA